MSTERPLPPYGPDGELPDDYVPLPHLDQTLEPVDGVVQPPILPPRWRPGRMTNTLQYLRKNVLMAVCKHKYSWPFLQPVNSIKLKIPDYHQIVKRPMDLTTINRRIDNFYYWDASECIDDFDLMMSNCFQYNGHEADVAIMARTLRDIFDKRMDKAPKIETAIKCIRTLPMQSAPGARAPRGKAVKVKEIKDPPPPKKERAPRKSRKPKREKKKYLSKKYVSSTSGSEAEFESQLRKELYDQESAAKKPGEDGEDGDAEMPAQDPEWDILEGMPLPEAFQVETNSDASKSSLPHKPVTAHKRGKSKREDADKPATSKPIAKAKRGRPRKRKDSPTPAAEEKDNTSTEVPLKDLPIINLADVDMKYQLGLSPTPFLLPVPKAESYRSPSSLKVSKPPGLTGKNIAACAEVILTQDPRSLLSPLLSTSPVDNRESIGSSPPRFESLVGLSPTEQPRESQTDLLETTKQREERSISDSEELPEPPEDIFDMVPILSPIGETPRRSMPQPPIDNCPSDNTSPASLWNSPLHMFFDNEEPSNVLKCVVDSSSADFQTGIPTIPLSEAMELLDIEERKSPSSSSPRGKSAHEDAEKSASPSEQIEPILDVSADNLSTPDSQTRGPKRRLSESKISPSRHSKEHKRKSKDQQSHEEVSSTLSKPKDSDASRAPLQSDPVSPRASPQIVTPPSQKASTSLSPELKASDDRIAIITPLSVSVVTAPPKSDIKESDATSRHEKEFDSRDRSKESKESHSASLHDKEKHKPHQRKKDGKKYSSTFERAERKPKHQEPPRLLPLELKADIKKGRPSSNEAKETSKCQQPPEIAPLKRKEDSETIGGFSRAAIERRKVPAMRLLEGKRTEDSETIGGFPRQAIERRKVPAIRPVEGRLENKEARSSSNDSKEDHTHQESLRVALGPKAMIKKYRIPFKEHTNRQQEPPGKLLLDNKEREKKHHLSVRDFNKSPGSLSLDRNEKSNFKESKDCERIVGFPKEAVARRKVAPQPCPMEGKAVEKTKEPQLFSREAAQRHKVAHQIRPLEDKKENHQARSSFKGALERRRVPPGHRSVEANKERQERGSSSREVTDRRKHRGPPQKMRRMLKEGVRTDRTLYKEGPTHKQPPRMVSLERKEDIQRWQWARRMHAKVGSDDNRRDRSFSKEAKERRIHQGQCPRRILVRRKKIALSTKEARMRQRHRELFGESPPRCEEQGMKNGSHSQQRRRHWKVRSPTDVIEDIDSPGYISPVEPDSMLKPSDEIIACHEILNTLMSSKYEAIAWPFYQQMSSALKAGMEQYLKAENPMDLSTIKRKLNGNYYVVREEFAYDVRLIFNNCFDLLPPDHDIYDTAIRLRDVFEGLYTQIDVELSNGMCVPSQCSDLNQLRDPALDNRIHYLTELEADFQRMMVSLKSIVQQMERQRMPPEEAVPQTPKPTPEPAGGAKKKRFDSDKNKTRGKDLTEEEKAQKKKERLAKAKEALCKPITLDEVQKLTCDISKMPADKLGHIVHILRTREPAYQDCNPNEVEIDLEPLNPRTIRELQMFVSSTLRQKRVVYYNPKAGLTRKEQALEKQKALEERLRELSSSLYKDNANPATSKAPATATDKSYSESALVALTEALKPITKPASSSSSSDTISTSSDEEPYRSTLSETAPKVAAAAAAKPVAVGTAGSAMCAASPAARSEQSVKPAASTAPPSTEAAASAEPPPVEVSAPPLPDSDQERSSRELLLADLSLSSSSSD